MDEELFFEYLELARAYHSADYSGFWDGYRRGLYRYYFKEKYGSDEEHEMWMEKANDDSKKKSIKDRGLGYRAGFAGKDPRPIMKVRMQ